IVGFPHDLLKPLNWKEHENPARASIMSTLRNLGFDVEIFEWRLDKTDGLYLVNELPQPLAYSMGSEEKLESRVESQAEWARILDDKRYVRVGWVFITPTGEMETIAGKFLDWAEAELDRRYGSIRKRVDKPVVQKISLCPELMISIARANFADSR
ncbi:MAG: hypothetical protein ACP5K8_09510, partial [Nitrososphaeria archaeon]